MEISKVEEALKESGLTGEEMISRIGASISKETFEQAFNWCRDNFKRINTINRRHNAYGLKHTLQKSTGIYLTSAQFICLMWLCGFRVEMEGFPCYKGKYITANGCFGVSEKSPAIRSKGE